MTDREQERDDRSVDDLTAWRYRRCRDLGLTRDEARAFAESGVPVGEIRALIEQGCPPATAARIKL